MTKVGLIGRCDHDNFGDSLMFAFYVKKLNGLGLTPYLIGASDIFMKRLHEEKLHCNNIEPEEVSILNIALFIGGGYFGQPDIGADDWNKRFLQSAYFYNIYKKLQANKIEYHVYGVEVGPIKFNEVKKQIGEIITGAKSVYVRNKKSKEYIENNFNCKVKSRRDIVLGETSLYFTCVSEEGGNKDTLVIHATGKVLKKNPISRMLRKKLCNLIGMNSHIRHVNILFDQTEYSNLERNAEEFRTELKLNNESLKVNIVKYKGLSDTLKVIYQSDYVVTTKLHVGITALSFGKEILCISSMPKNQRFYNEVFKGQGIIKLFSVLYPWNKLKIKDFVSIKENNYEYNESKKYIEYLEELIK